MDTKVSIGEFARLTHLTVKALRHYHDVGLLEPTHVDPFTSYRRYSIDQVRSAQLIRRLRLLDMPVPAIAAVVNAPDDAARQRVLREQLERMEDHLGQIGAAVASLRSLLQAADEPLAVQYRAAEALPVFASRAVVDRAEVAQWCGVAFPMLYESLATAGIDASGPAGATYSNEFFSDDSGEVVAYVPVPAGYRGPPGVESVELPAVRLAVAVHAGPFTELDRTYGRLGSQVAQQDRVADGPIREIYLIGPVHTADPAEYRTEVCWPVQPTILKGKS